MKKKWFVIIFVVVLVCLFSLSFFVGRKGNDGLSNNPDVIMANAEKESAAVRDEEKRAFIEINLDQYLEYYGGSEKKLILLARPSCEYSVIAFPILQNIMYEYDFDIFYLNSDNFVNDELLRFSQSNDLWKDGIGTPKLFFVKNNSIMEKVEGLVDRAHYLEFFKLNGIISKE